MHVRLGRLRLVLKDVLLLLVGVAALRFLVALIAGLLLSIDFLLVVLVALASVGVPSLFCVLLIVALVVFVLLVPRLVRSLVSSSVPSILPPVIPFVELPNALLLPVGVAFFPPIPFGLVDVSILWPSLVRIIRGAMVIHRLGWLVLLGQFILAGDWHPHQLVLLISLIRILLGGNRGPRYGHVVMLDSLRESVWVLRLGLLLTVVPVPLAHLINYILLETLEQFHTNQLSQILKILL